MLFRNEYSFLSNYAKYYEDEYMEFDELIYKSNEHFYNAMKFEDTDIRQKISICAARDIKSIVSEHKNLISHDWHDIKLMVMEIGLEYKFSLPRFKKMLLATGDIEIIEHNSWNDKYWGVCNDKGKNHLGRLIMKIRNKYN